MRVMFLSLLSAALFILGACSAQSLSFDEIKSRFDLNRRSFVEIVAMLKEGGELDEGSFEPEAAKILDPRIAHQDERYIILSASRMAACKKIFEDINLLYPVTVFKHNGHVLFVLSAKGFAVGGGGTTRGIAYIPHAETAVGYRVVVDAKDAEVSTCGGTDLVRIEGDWYAYYVNPS